MLIFFVATRRYIELYILPTLHFNNFFFNGSKVFILNMSLEIFTWVKKEKVVIINFIIFRSIVY